MDDTFSEFDLLRWYGDRPEPPAGYAMGLAETVAWIATRDSRFIAAIRAYRNWADAQDAASEAMLWGAIHNHIGKDKYLEAERTLFDEARAGIIRAEGYAEGGAQSADIVPRAWRGARILYLNSPDSFETEGHHNSIGSILRGSVGTWTDVEFERRSIMERWESIARPAPPPAPTIAPTPPAAGKGGRNKPDWHPTLERLYSHQLKRRNDALELGRPAPTWPTDKQFLAGVLRDSNGECSATAHKIKYHRQNLDREHGRTKDKK